MASFVESRVVSLMMSSTIAMAPGVKDLARVCHHYDRMRTTAISHMTIAQTEVILLGCKAVKVFVFCSLPRQAKVPRLDVRPFQKSSTGPFSCMADLSGK